MIEWRITLVPDSDQLLGELWYSLVEYLAQTSKEEDFTMDVGDADFPCLLVVFNKSHMVGELYRALKAHEEQLVRRTLARAVVGDKRYQLIRVSM